MKPLVALLAAALLVAAACSESALPTETKLEVQPLFATIVQGGCPAPFTLTIVEGDADGVAADRNGDGLACYLPDEQDAMNKVRAWTDNNVPLSQIGGCPNGFDLAPSGMTGMETFDRNGDFLVCTRSSGNGSTIVVDNNHRTQGM